LTISKKRTRRVNVQAPDSRKALRLAWDPSERSASDRGGEESFYLIDPFGNPLCFVSAGSVFKG
jgi:hypothetical protein